MPPPCPQCGAALPPGETCQDRCTADQLKEVEQPAYYAVHHLADSEPLVRALGAR